MCKSKQKSVLFPSHWIEYSEFFVEFSKIKDHCALGWVYGELCIGTPYIVVSHSVNGLVYLIVWMSLHVFALDRRALRLPLQDGVVFLHSLTCCEYAALCFFHRKEILTQVVYRCRPCLHYRTPSNRNVYASAELPYKTMFQNVLHRRLATVHHCVAEKLLLAVLVSIHIADSSIDVSTVWYTQIVVANDMLRAIWWSSKTTWNAFTTRGNNWKKTTT